jgi:hypothetical protein
MDIITGKILKLNNWQDGRVIGLAKDAGNKMIANGMERDTALAQLEAVRSDPGSYLTDPLLADLARECIRLTQKDEVVVEELLRESPLPFPIWGDKQIDPEAIKQMENAMRLPVTVTGALMPDAHVGYGLPIGGVLATENASSPTPSAWTLPAACGSLSTKSRRSCLDKRKACSKMPCGSKPLLAWARSGRETSAPNMKCWTMTHGMQPGC